MRSSVFLSLLKRPKKSTVIVRKFNLIITAAILLTPGAGHMEKNLFLALFRTCSPIFIKGIADNLGSKSKATKEFIAN